MRFLAAAIVLSSMGRAQTKVDGPVVMFIGPPMSGKSTQAVVAARLLNLPNVSADELIQANQATFAEIRRSGIAGMEPHSDPVLNRLFLARLEKGDLSHGVVLDGYPSTKDHGDYLARLVRSGTLPTPLVIRLEIPDKVVLQRMQKAPAAQRKSVEQRLKDYHREMDMVQVYFPGAHVVHVDGTKNVKSVEGEVARILQERYGPNGGRR